MPVMAVMVIFVAVILKQPDLGTAVAIAGTVMVIIFVAGMQLWQLFLIVLAALPAMAYLVFSESYRLQRWLSFLDPWADPLKTGYQVIQSLYAIGSGGLFGIGLGFGRQKMFYLPSRTVISLFRYRRGTRLYRRYYHAAFCFLFILARHK